MVTDTMTCIEARACDEAMASGTNACVQTLRYFSASNRLGLFSMTSLERNVLRG